jgi:hypothetical protein
MPQSAAVDVAALGEQLEQGGIDDDYYIAVGLVVAEQFDVGA